MFSYYGSKSKLLKFYPSPKYATIVEPFAGSARYSLQFPDRQVELYDSNEVVVGIWEWLLSATISDVQNLPDLQLGDDVYEFKELSRVERDLLGFIVGMGRATPGRRVTARAVKNKVYPKSHPYWRPNGEIELFKKRAISLIPQIRHWVIRCQSFHEINVDRDDCTWFIDPPYQNAAGRLYPNHDIDYGFLGLWCTTLNGQTIVCEGGDADWLDFRVIKEFRGSRKTSKELLWTNEENS